METLLVNEKEMARRLGLSPKTLQAQRVDGTGVPYVKIGRTVRYDINVVDDFLKAETFISTSDHTKKPRVKRRGLSRSSNTDPPIWDQTRSLTAQGPDPKSINYWRALFKKEVPKRQRNIILTSIIEYLIWSGVDASVVNELVRAWNVLHCNPPMFEGEVDNILTSIFNKETKRLNAEMT